MPKVFCLFCVKFKVQSWCLGYCTEKNMYIKKVVRNCARSYITKHVQDNPAEVLAWYNRAAEWAKMRYELVKQYHYIGDVEDGQL